MLFRPLTEKRLLGLRLPLTPGIIPRQRHTLAESIGVMVSRDLITEDAVRSQLSSPDFGATVQNKFKELLELLLYTPTAGLPQRLSLPEIEREGAAASVGGELSSTGTRADSQKRRGSRGGAESLVTEVLIDFFNTEGFKTSIHRTVVYSIESICALPVEKLAGKDGERLLSFLSRERFEQMREPVKINFRLWLKGQINSERKFASILNPQIIDGIGGVLDHLYPSLFQAFLEYLRSPQVHRKLELRGKVILQRILDKLSNFQRFFVLAGQYDRTLDERMDVVVDDVLEQLERAGWDYETRARLINMLKSWLRGVSNKSAAELDRAWRGDMVEDATAALDSLFDWLGSDRGLEVLRSMGESMFKRLSDEQLGTAVYRFAGIQTETLSQTLADWVVGMIEAGGDGGEEPQIWKLLKSMAGEISAGGSKSIAQIIGLSDADRDRLEAEAARFFLRVLNEQVPMILESVDVKGLVIEKIDSLDIEKVEDLILQVIRSHLRWISAFGAILGFLIGGIQLVVFFMSPG
jgi:uncharacterized membrane-anchored protein YjiN (DUF445 family)